MNEEQGDSIFPNSSEVYGLGWISSIQRFNGNLKTLDYTVAVKIDEIANPFVDASTTTKRGVAFPASKFNCETLLGTVWFANYGEYGWCRVIIEKIKKNGTYVIGDSKAIIVGWFVFDAYIVKLNWYS